MNSEKVMIVESDPKIVELAAIKLSNAGYLVTTATSSAELLQKIESTPPDIVVINPNLTDGDGYDTCAEFGKRFELKNIPIILLIDDQFNEDLFKNVGVKVADLLLKPFNPRTLLTHVNSVVVKVRLIKKLNPLTRLPGRLHVQEEVEFILKEKRQFTLVFVDLKGFKAYNKQYGYEEGNQVIKFTANLIRTELDHAGIDAEVFHFGGDKFAILFGAVPVEEIAANIIRRFDQEIPGLYRENDQIRGGIVITNRQGMVEQWPIMTIAIGIVTNELRVFTNWLDVETVGTELIEFAKTIPGSAQVKDRRRS